MDLNRPNFGIHEHLHLRVVPVGAQNLLHKKLIEAGPLGPGNYECWIDTKGINNLDVYLEPTAVNAGGTPSIASMSLQVDPTTIDEPRQNVALDTTTGVAFVANTVQKLSLTTLNGTWRVKVKFTVTTSIDFTPATTHGRAEVRGM